MLFLYVEHISSSVMSKVLCLMTVQCGDESFVISCDWLQYSVILEESEPELLCPDGFRLEILPGNNVFRNRCILYRGDGLKVATMLWWPYSRILNPRLATVQVANYCLYADAIQWTHAVVSQVWSCRFNSMGRVDICCDFATPPARWTLLRSLATGAAYVQGKGEGSVWWHMAANNSDGVPVRSPHAMSWGRPQSEIRVKVYNKTHELDPKGVGEYEKPYIVERWREAGLDPSQVWRCEFAMQSSGQLRWQGKPISLADVACSEWVGSVFLALYEKRFVLRYNDGRRAGHHNDDRRACLLPLPSGLDNLRWAAPRGNGLPTSEAITLLRKLMVQMEGAVAMASSSVFDALVSAVMEVCRIDGVRTYFGWRFGCPPEEYCRRVRTTVGQGVFVPDAAPSKMWL